AANTGTGVIQSSGGTDHAAWSSQALRLQFTASDVWRRVDGAGNELTTGSYAEGGATISSGGMQLTLAGTPAVGDSFTVEPAPVRDVFATLQGLADALEAPVSSAAEIARCDNLVGAALGDIASAQDHMLALRSATGSRLAALAGAPDTRASADPT